ncbi:TMhelix containing protein [Vibrio vulnificus]
MKLTKGNLILLGLSALIAAGVVWASNNVDAVEDVIG